MHERYVVVKKNTKRESDDRRVGRDKANVKKKNIFIHKNSLPVMDCVLL